ncbi:protein Jade-3-like isoform X2 [Gordionus sp. m RMFG-2023]
MGVENFLKKRNSHRMTRLLSTLNIMRHNKSVNSKFKLKQEKIMNSIRYHPYDVSKFSEKYITPAFSSNNKPAELYRTDLISAMKVPDSEYFSKDDYITLSDPWRGEWDKGVQIPVCFIDDLNKPNLKNISIYDILESKSLHFSNELHHLFLSNLSINTMGLNNKNDYLPSKRRSLKKIEDLHINQATEYFTNDKIENTDRKENIFADNIKININRLYSSYYHPSDLRKYKNNSMNFENNYHQYNIDLMDLIWLKTLNSTLLIDDNSKEPLKKDFNTNPYLSIKLFEGIMLELEKSCYTNFKDSFLKEKEIALEYDENVICDVCRSPDSEEGNEMVFCDICNICVHQACYGIVKIPRGSWLCNPCQTQSTDSSLLPPPSLPLPSVSPSSQSSHMIPYSPVSTTSNTQPRCCLCPNPGGALKPTPSGSKWCHVSCALWIPEIGIGDPDKMEPITGIARIPAERWNFVCAVCKGKRNGACIQCSVKSCRIAFHVTCGFKGGLDMKADWHHHVEHTKKYCNPESTSSTSTINTQHPDVKLKAYCPKHSRKKGLHGTPQKNFDPSPTSVFINSANHMQLSNSNIEESRFQKLKQMESEFYEFVHPEQEVNKILLPLPSLPFHDKDCFYRNTSHKSTQRSTSSTSVTEISNIPSNPHPTWIRRVFSLTYNYWKQKRRLRFNSPLVSDLVPLSKVNSRNDNALNQNYFDDFSNTPHSIPNPTLFDMDNCYSSASVANSLFSEDCFNPINFSSLTQQQVESNLYHRLRMCVQLRQDLERVRNLSYMLIRREKLSSAYVESRKAVFDKQIQLLNNFPSLDISSIIPNIHGSQDLQYLLDEPLLERVIKLPPPPVSPTFIFCDNFNDNLLDKPPPKFNHLDKPIFNSFYPEYKGKLQQHDSNIKNGYCVR